MPVTDQPENDHGAAPPNRQPFSTDGFRSRIAKPWGEEVIFTPRWLGRTGKIISIKAGKRLSFQYHDAKEETMALLSGEALIWLENAGGGIEKIPMRPLEGYTVLPLQKHRLEAVTDAVIIEVSSPEAGNTVRIEDDYARGTETEEIREQPDRGWK